METAQFNGSSPGVLQETTQKEPLAQETGSRKKTLYIVLSVVFGVIAALVIGTLALLFSGKCKMSKGAKYGAKPEEPVVQYRTHAPSIGSSSSYGSTAPLLRQRSLRSRLGSNLTQVSEVEVPLDEEWEIDREQIRLLGVLGEGAFGKVMKADVLGLPNWPFSFNVAVKMLKGLFPSQIE